MTNNSNPLNGYRFDTREKGIETRGEQFAKLVNGSTASNKEADAKQDKEIKKVANDLAAFKKNVYTKPQADGKFLTDKSLTPYAKKADVYTKAEVDAKIPPEQDLSLYAKIEYVDDQISSLVAGAPGELDTLREAADAINANIDSINAISAGLDAKANADDVYNKTEVDSALAEKANTADLDAKANAADVYTKSEVDGLIPDVSEKVDWVESEGGRKHIVLPNHNNLLGTDTEGTTYNLAMVSKWNVADFGTSKLHMNLNSVDGNVTINDDKQIATVDQIPDVSGFASKQELEEAVEPLASKNELETLAGKVYTKNEVDDLIPDVSEKVDWVESEGGRKHIVLPNHNNILGTDTAGTTYNLAMVSKWNVADFGTSQLHMNLNSVDGNVTINDDKQVATVDQIPDVTGFAAAADVEAIDARVTALENVTGDSSNVIVNFTETGRDETNPNFMMVSGTTDLSQSEIAELIAAGKAVYLNVNDSDGNVVKYMSPAGGDTSVTGPGETADNFLFNFMQDGNNVVFYANKIASQRNLEATNARVTALENGQYHNVFVNFTETGRETLDNGVVKISGTTDIAEAEIAEFISQGLSVYINTNDSDGNVAKYMSAQGGQVSMLEVNDDPEAFLFSFEQNGNDVVFYARGLAKAGESYTKAEVDAMLAEKQNEIDEILVNFNRLKEVVRDLGGDVDW